MINREVILAGCRAYAQAAWDASDDAAEQVAQVMARGATVTDAALLAALAAAVDVDRHLPVTPLPVP